VYKITVLKILVLIILVSCVSIKLNAQKIELNINKKPLNEVFLELHNKYGIQFSFNDKLLSICIVSNYGSFNSPKQAISSLLQDCNLAFELNKNVFIIYAKREIKEISKPILHIFSGRISDKTNTEALPFSNIEINSNGSIADVNGNFSFKSFDSVAVLKISHIGYFVLDTIFSSGTNQNLKLIPSIVDLQEVAVSSNAISYDSYIGEKSGLIKLNHKIATFLPGINDNTIFNLLRLQPGILASAEQTNDYTIWGSYKGQNLILFDGIPLFSLSSFNDKIGAINPLIVKDIEIIKGGYNSNIGGRVGGVINITGKSGNPNNFNANLNINNQTLSGILGIPFKGKSSLQVSFRQSYYQLLNWNNIFNINEKKISDTYSPDFMFQDINIKFSGKNGNSDNYYISLFACNDKSSYQFSKISNKLEYSINKETKKKQIGGAFFYNKNWKKAGTTNTSIVYSRLKSDLYDDQLYKAADQKFPIKTETFLKNSISELSVKTDHFFPTNRNHSLNIGFGFINNTSSYNQDSTGLTKKDSFINANRLSFYFKDNVSVSEKINFQVGLRLDYTTNISKLYYQPRINLTIKPFEKWKINFAWGIYNQFIAENALVDYLNNYIYLWNICDNKNISVLSGMQYVTGFSYSYNGFDYSIEGFYKTTDGLNRFISKQNSNHLTIVNGKSRSCGIDFFIKKKMNNHNFWIAYTLSKTEEKFPHFSSNNFQRAEQDQRHEVKLAALFNFNPYFISTNYVYGSGLGNTIVVKKSINKAYSRLDLAFMYKIQAGKLKMETGLSIINLLNTENIRYNNSSNFPDNKTIYSEAMPFSPTLFLNIGF